MQLSTFSHCKSQFGCQKTFHSQWINYFNYLKISNVFRPTKVLLPSHAPTPNSRTARSLARSFGRSVCRACARPTRTSSTSRFLFPPTSSRWAPAWRTASSWPPSPLRCTSTTARSKDSPAQRYVQLCVRECNNHTPPES